MANTILVKKNTILRFFPLQTIITAIIVIFLFYAFFSGLTYQFYASVVFSFYALTKSMWISVVCLGVFQTILMIPLRIVRLLKENHIKEFTSNIIKLNDERTMNNTIKENVSKGNITFLFYLVDFVIQLVSFVTIGRLFLTDFYNFPLDPAKLYSFVPYPEYPIKDVFFKIPYPVVTQTVDFGLKAVIIAWIILGALQALIYFARIAYRNAVRRGENKSALPKKLTKYASGYLLIAMLASYFLIRHFPVGLSVGIFSGSVAVQNSKFNTLTATATFLTILYFGIPKNIRKAHLAEEAGVPTHIIEKTQKQMLGESLKNATLIGLGAYFITNQIPSAFELSIFTLEIISLASPLTLDRIILSSVSKPAIVESASDEKKSDEDVKNLSTNHS
ncbi:hypothetical protein KJZ63_02255 [Patescibacteria group bacterium]|nr:hypothetical protein [Patescibacteria group bacterium]